MVRAILGFSLLASFVGLAGCTMCCPQDYHCGPVYAPGWQTCCPSARAGSILAGPGCGGCQTVGGANVSATHALKEGSTAGDAELGAKHKLKWGSPADEAELSAKHNTKNTKWDDADGSEGMVVVSDRVVKPAATPAPSEKTAARTDKPAEKSTADADRTSVRPVGWTAHRPDGEE